MQKRGLGLLFTTIGRPQCFYFSILLVLYQLLFVGFEILGSRDNVHASYFSGGLKTFF